MLIIEFFDGHLNGTALPLDGLLTITGAENTSDDNTLNIPEILPPNAHLIFEAKDNKVFANGLIKKNKLKKIAPNKIYTYKGVSFFVYFKGKRSPNIKRFRLNQYKLISLVLVISFIIIVVISYLKYKHQQQYNIDKYLTTIKNGYIKEGKLFVFNNPSLKELPKYLEKNIHIIKDSKYMTTSQLNIELVSSYKGTKLKAKLKETATRDIITVQTFELENKIMKVLSSNNINFEKKGKNWLVSDRDLAFKVFRKNRLESQLIYLKSKVHKSDIIDKSEFPYYIFYSTTAGRYIYDSNNKYWEGSMVPKLGIIKSISNKEILFKDGNKNRIYLIQR